MKEVFILLPPFMFATVVGVAISSPLILYGRKRGWFKDELISKRQFEEKLDEAFHGRTPLTDDEFYEAFFAKQGILKEIPLAVKRIFEEQFGADFSRIHDDDDFSKELRFIWNYDSLVDVAIVIAIEEEFGIKVSDAEATEMKTIKAIVETVWAKKSHRREATSPSVPSP
jgi:acyl carrier protein